MPEEVKQQKKIEKADYRNFSEWLSSTRYAEICVEQYHRFLQAHTKCQCGHNIVLSQRRSYKIVNKWKLCMSCANNLRIHALVKGSRSYYPSPYVAARFNTLCALQRAKRTSVPY